MEKRELFYTVGGNVNCYNHCEKQYKNSLKKKKAKNRTNDLAVSIFSLYPGKTLI